MQNFNRAPNQEKVYNSYLGTHKYKLGLIDFLTEYDTFKKMETKWNNMRYWNGKEEASC